MALVRIVIVNLTNRGPVMGRSLITFGVLHNILATSGLN